MSKSIFLAEVNFMDENLQGREKAIPSIFFVMKLFEHNITFCKLITYGCFINKILEMLKTT